MVAEAVADIPPAQEAESVQAEDPQIIPPIPAIPSYLLPSEKYELSSNPSTPPETTLPSKPIPPAAPAPSISSISTTPLPEGLTHSSPSVIANPHLVRSYQDGEYEFRTSLITDTTDMQTVLSLFNWSISKTEIGDARAWYMVIAKDSPTAVSPPD